MGNGDEAVSNIPPVDDLQLQQLCIRRCMDAVAGDKPIETIRQLGGDVIAVDQKDAFRMLVNCLGKDCDAVGVVYASPDGSMTLTNHKVGAKTESCPYYKVPNQISVSHTSAA